VSVRPGSPRRRGRRPKTYEAVLAATSSLLETVPLADLSVAQILAAAGVGRTSFYEHFGSKDDVVVKLMRTVSAEVGSEIEPMFQRDGRTPDAAFAEGLRGLLAVAERYRGLLVAVIEEWPAVPELRAIWFTMQGRFSARLADTIDRDREAGLAPAGGASAESLAAALVWTAERAFHVAMTGQDRALPDAAALIDPLVQLFVSSIYGRPLSSARA
jgi:AcrR family transcriptional regulator